MTAVLGRRHDGRAGWTSRPHRLGRPPRPSPARRGCRAIHRSWCVFAGQSGACSAGRGRVTPATLALLIALGARQLSAEECVVAISQQRRGRSIAMTPAELDEFLARAHTCRVATLAPAWPACRPALVRLDRRGPVAELAGAQPALGRPDPRSAGRGRGGRRPGIPGTTRRRDQGDRRAGRRGATGAARTTLSWPRRSCCSRGNTWAATRWCTTGGTDGCASRRSRSPAGTSASCHPDRVSRPAEGGH